MPSSKLNLLGAGRDSGFITGRLLGLGSFYPLKSISNLVYPLTYGKGKIFEKLETLADKLKAKIYLAHTRTSWGRV